MKTIYLVRHCIYDNPLKIYPGRLPVPLTEEGLQQAERLKKYFSDKHLEKIYSSAVLRCKQTAEIIADNSIPVEFDQRLLETFSAYQGYWGGNVGTAEGWDEFYAHQKELGGETYPNVQKRALEFAHEVVTRPEDTIIICSHGDPLHFMYLGLSNKELPHWKNDTGEYGDPDYLKKGYVRPIFYENNTFRCEPLIAQDQLGV